MRPFAGIGVARVQKLTLLLVDLCARMSAGICVVDVPKLGSFFYYLLICAPLCKNWRGHCAKAETCSV